MPAGNRPRPYKYRLRTHYAPQSFRGDFLPFAGFAGPGGAIKDIQVTDAASDGFAKSVGGKLLDEAKSQVGVGDEKGLPVKPGKPSGHLENARKTSR